MTEIQAADPLDEFKRVSRVYAAFAAGVLFFGATFVTGLIGDFELTGLGATLLWTSMALILSSLLVYAVAEWNVLSLRIFHETMPSNFSLLLGLLQLLLVVAAVALIAAFVITALEGDSITRLDPMGSPAPLTD